MSLDLELTPGVDGFKHIVEIGYCFGDVASRVITKPKSLIVCPPVLVDPRITTLTGITQAATDSGVCILDAYDTLRKDWRESGASYLVVTWGGDDMDCLRRNVVYAGGDTKEWPFGRRIIDTKTLFQARAIEKGEKPQSGLAKASNRLGLPFTGTKHRAGDDAYNTLRLYFKLTECFL